MPGKRVGGTIEQRSVTRIVRTGDHDVHWHVGEQRRVRATLERPTRGGAAVVSEHGDLRRLDRACGDQDWLGTRAHNTFDLGADMIGRSEEHTSELQSLMRISYAVFCLKKKNNTKQS